MALNAIKKLKSDDTQFSGSRQQDFSDLEINRAEKQTIVTCQSHRYYICMKIMHLNKKCLILILKKNVFEKHLLTKRNWE